MFARLSGLPPGWGGAGGGGGVEGDSIRLRRGEKNFSDSVDFPVPLPGSVYDWQE